MNELEMIKFISVDFIFFSPSKTLTVVTLIGCCIVGVNTVANRNQAILIEMSTAFY